MALVGAHELSQGDEVVADGVVVGAVTSVVRSLDDSRTIALAYIRGEHANEGTSIGVRHNDEQVAMSIQLPPVED